MSERNWETEFWDIIIFDNAQERRGLDPIERAALDQRLIDAARFALNGQISDVVRNHDGFVEALAQVGEEYMLGPEEVMAAVDITQGRIGGVAL